MIMCSPEFRHGYVAGVRVYVDCLTRIDCNSLSPMVSAALGVWPHGHFTMRLRRPDS